MFDSRFNGVKGLRIQIFYLYVNSRAVESATCLQQKAKRTPNRNMSNKGLQSTLSYVD